MALKEGKIIQVSLRVGLFWFFRNLFMTRFVQKESLLIRSHASSSPVASK